MLLGSQFGLNLWVHPVLVLRSGHCQDLVDDFGACLAALALNVR